MNKYQFSLVVALTLTLLLGASGLASLAAAATPTPTPTPTRTPTPRPAPTATPLTAALKKQLIFGAETFPLSLFDGVLPGCPTWDELKGKVKQNPKLPYIHTAARTGDIQSFCVYGVNDGDGLAIELTRPDGSSPAPAQLRSEFQGTFATLIQNEPYAETVSGYSIPADPAAAQLYLWFAAGMPTGKWRLAVSNPDGDLAQAEFNLKTGDPLPAMGLNKPKVGPVAKDASPFKLPVVNRDCQPFNRGETATIYLVNLRPETNYEVGVYRPNPDDNEKIDRIDKIRFKTNKKGNQQINYTASNDLAPGPLRFLLPTNGGTEQWWEAGPSICLELQ
jgi:hypothetical protein